VKFNIYSISVRTKTNALEKHKIMGEKMVVPLRGRLSQAFRTTNQRYDPVPIRPHLLHSVCTYLIHNRHSQNVERNG